MTVAVPDQLANLIAAVNDYVRVRGGNALPPTDMVAAMALSRVVDEGVALLAMPPHLTVTLPGNVARVVVNAAVDIGAAIDEMAHDFAAQLGVPVSMVLPGYKPSPWPFDETETLERVP